MCVCVCVCVCVCTVMYTCVCVCVCVDSGTAVSTRLEGEGGKENASVISSGQDSTQAET